MTASETPKCRRAAVLAACALLLFALPLPARGAADYGELVHRGLGQLEKGQFEEAAASLREALDAEPASLPARRGLARAWAALALAHLRAGRLQESRELLDDAVEIQPEAAEYRLQLAAVLFRQNEVRGARREIDEALELAPDSAPARELSGDLYAREGQLNRAIGEWETAAAAAGSPALTEKIARGRREMAAEEGMGRETSRYFVVLFDRDVPRPLVQEFFAVLDQAYDILHEELGEYPRDEITVILYSQREFRDVTLAPEWSGGQYDGKIRIPVGGLKTVEDAAGLLMIIVHEMTHAFLHRMAPTGLPRWFEEGLATTYQGWDPARLRAWLSEHPPEGLETLEAVNRTLLGRGGSVQPAYIAARLALDEMVAARGMGAVRRIISGVGAGGAFPDVFREEMRMDVAEFEERWRSGLR